MTTKEYLSQAYRLDQRINSKIEQVASLNDLAIKATSVLTGMPHEPSPSASRMANVIAKIIDLQGEINEDIDRLVDLKVEIVNTIRGISNLQYQIVLEKRYLCFFTWEQIAEDMDYDLRYLYKIHNRALKAVDFTRAA